MLCGAVNVGFRQSTSRLVRGGKMPRVLREKSALLIAVASYHWGYREFSHVAYIIYVA